MDEKLTNVCETFLFNRNEMVRILRSGSAPMHLMCAAVLTALGQRADEEAILKAENLLKENEPVTSLIRGRIKSVTTAHMMLSGDIEAYYNDLRRTHELLFVNRGGDDERYYLAAMMMSDKISNMQEILMLVDRTSLIHEGMGNSHFTLEERASYVSAAFAAANGVINVNAYLAEVRACEERLKKGMVVVEVTDDLCMMLALSSVDVETKCEMVEQIAEAFENAGIDFDRAEEAFMLAFLAELQMDTDKIVEAVREADQFIKDNIGFDDELGSILSHVYAAMLVTMAYAPELSNEDFKKKIEEDPEFLKRVVLMQSQSVMHIQMQYVNEEDLNI